MQECIESVWFMSFLFLKWYHINTLKSEQNGCYFVDAIFICIFVKDSNCLFELVQSVIEIELKQVIITKVCIYIYIKHLSEIIIKTPHCITQNLTLIFQWSFNIYHQMYDTLWRLTYGKLLHLSKSELILLASVLKSARFMYQQWNKMIKCIQTTQIHPPTPFLSLLMFFLSFLLLNANLSWFFVIILIINKWYYRKTSNISRTLVGNKIVDNSDVVRASPVGFAPTTSSFST